MNDCFSSSSEMGPEKDPVSDRRTCDVRRGLSGDWNSEEPTGANELLGLIIEIWAQPNSCYPFLQHAHFAAPRVATAHVVRGRCSRGSRRGGGGRGGEEAVNVAALHKAAVAADSNGFRACGTAFCFETLSSSW